MTIASSVLREDALQTDGRRRVTEAHTDHLGAVYLRTYLATGGFDAAAQLAARAAEIETQLADEEFGRDLDRITQRLFTGLTTNHLTLAQLRTRLRAYYVQATPLEVCVLATFFLTLSDAQLQSLFSVTAGQLPALKARLQTRADLLISLDAATGE